MTTVRNEGDIVAQTLSYAAQQMNLILVVDCGSEDDTICEVKKVAKKFDHVVLIGKLQNHHARQVRRHIWEHVHRHLSINDWWAVVDADEFAEQAIREKVKRAHKELADHIFSIHANFYYTESEANAWYEGKESLLDRSRPIETRRKFYRMHTSQIRLFRNLPWLRWNNDTSWPDRLSKPASERIIYRHYQYRDIPQIQLRLKTRRDIKATPDLVNDNPHWFYNDVSRAISSDHNTSLHRYIPGKEFNIDESLPPAPNQNLAKSIGKYCLAIAESIKPQAQSTLLSTTEPQSIISRIKSF